MALIDFRSKQDPNRIITFNADKIVSICDTSNKETLVATVDPDNYVVIDESREEAVRRWDSALHDRRREEL